MQALQDPWLDIIKEEFNEKMAGKALNNLTKFRADMKL